MDSSQYSKNKIKSVVVHNLKTTIENIQWNLQNGIKLYRLSSELIPKASHPLFRKWVVENWIWYEDPDILNLFNEIRQLNINYGLHLTLHPGQYTVLNSINSDVVDKSFIDLMYHYWILDQIKGEFLIVHTGGYYRDKIVSSQRFVNHLKLRITSQEYLDKLVVENDDKIFNYKDVCSIAQQANILPLFDFHHDRCNPTPDKELKKLISASYQKWKNKGRIFKVHLSSGRAHLFDRSHADFVKQEDLQKCIDLLEECGVEECYIMLECKNKNRSLLDLLRSR